MPDLLSDCESWKVAASQNRGMLLRSTSRYRYLSRLRLHPLEPGTDGREAIEIEVSFVGDVGVSIERDIGDRVVIRDEEVATRRCPSMTPRASYPSLRFGPST